MRIGGLQKCSTVDFPKRLACVLFTQGCNFRCAFCHNPELVNPKLFGPPLDPEAIFRFLEKRKNVLDGVVLSGGEPTLQKDLPEYLQTLKTMGFATKLDTNGTHPEVLQSLLQRHCLDFVAMDIKHRLEPKCYEALTGPFSSFQSIEESRKLLLKSSITYEFRTTLIHEIHTQEDVLAMASALQDAPQWTLQTFRPQKTLNPQWQQFHPWPPEAMDTLRILLSQKFPKLNIRYL